MYYRSDWPEVGLPTALNQSSPVDLAAHPDDGQIWIGESEVAGALFRRVATKSQFESNLYGFPIWNLHIEIDDADGNVLTAQLDSPTLRKSVNELVRQLSDASLWGVAYVSAKLVKDEPLYDALRQVGFEEVEHRRIYRCKVRDIVSEVSLFSESNARFTSLAAIPPQQLPVYHRQMLDICREAFGAEGHSRHFADSVLLERLPGVSYILTAMASNFEQVTSSHFLIAVDSGSGQVCGFSAVGKKPALKEDTYTQLLSAVRKAYRGRGIYRGLTHLLQQTLPQDATLLNVVHADNHAIQRAYRDSGRAHLADTVVLRRVYSADK